MSILKNTLFTGLIMLLLPLPSCKKFLSGVDVPNNQVKNDMVFASDATATSAVLGIYANLMAQADGFARGLPTGLSALCGLSADELDFYSNQSGNIAADQFERNELSADNANVLSLWVSMYKTIYMANAVIEGLNSSTGVSGNTRNQLKGEALFLRAFSYFYLASLYGDVPLALTTDYGVNATLARTNKDAVMDQVVMDLIQSQELMPEGYIAPDKERIRINKLAATALLARVHLYKGSWSQAEAQSSIVIGKSSFYNLEADVNNVFLKNSREAIWQLRPNYNFDKDRGYTEEGLYFSLAFAPTNNVLRPQVANSFEIGDRRRTSWVTGFDFGGQTLYRPTKYISFDFSAPLTEYSMVLRLGEQYLVRAESRARQNKLAGAINDMDSVRYRAGLPLIHDMNPGIGEADLLLAIEKERKLELFTEWGHRWLDLKRTGRAVSVLGTLKDGFSSNDPLYPIPQSERNKNPQLSQNAGY